MTPTIATETLLTDLAQLSDIDLAKKRLEPKSARSIELTQEAKGLRTRIPASVLLHYDARLSRGKRGAARMRNNTCGGCHLALPSGQLADMRHADAALVLCCNCSIYLLPSLPDEPAPAVAAEATKPTVAKKAAVKKPRKPKATQAIAADETAASAEEELETEVDIEAAAARAIPAEAQVEAEIEAEAEIALPA